MILPDGSEVLCTLALPLPCDLVGEMGPALTEAAERAGYVDVVLLTDGTNRVVARRGPWRQMSALLDAPTRKD